MVQEKPFSRIYCSVDNRVKHAQRWFESWVEIRRGPADFEATAIAWGN